MAELNYAVWLNTLTMGDVISTAVENLNTILSSPDWSPPSAIYSNFNFSTWALPSFPAVPSGNQVAAKYNKNPDGLFYLLSHSRLFKYICCCGTPSACFATGSNLSAPGPFPVQQYQGVGGRGGRGGRDEVGGKGEVHGGIWIVLHIIVCRTQLEPRSSSLMDISMRSHSNQEREGGERKFPGEF